MKNSKMKKSLSLILSLIMILSTLSALTVTSFAGNSFESAESLIIGMQYTITDAGYHYYVFTLDTSSVVTFSHSCIDGNNTSILFNAKKENIGNASNSSYALTPGTYYLREYVYGNPNKVIFTVKVEPSYESFTENDESFYNPYNISLNNQYRGSLSYNEEQDFFKFVLYKDTNLNIDFEGSSKLFLSILDSKGVQLWSQRVTTSSPDKSAYNGIVYLKSGTYYLKIDAEVWVESGILFYGSGNYNFKLSESNSLSECDMHGHLWGTAVYTWSPDNSKVLVTRVCTRDSAHIETLTVSTISQVTLAPTATSNGIRTYTAVFASPEFETQTKEVIVPKTGESDNYKGFPDVKEGAWYYDAVKHCAQKGYISGYQNGNFGPNDNLKRQDFVVILSKIAGADLDKYAAMTPKLNDVKKGAYYAAAVNWAVDNSIIAGYANGNFGVNDNITREQVATILYRYMKSPEVKNVDSTLKKFSDVNRISSFAKTAVAWAVQNNVISGMADGRVAPTEGAARAQIASIIMRMDQQGMFDRS